MSDKKEEGGSPPPGIGHSLASGEPLDERQMNPLLIDHVVERILEKLGKCSDKKELLRSREVCKTWNEIGSKVFKLLDSTGISFSLLKSKKLETFLEIMTTNESLVFRRFFFDADFFVLETRELFYDFLKKFSPFLAHLDIWIGEDFTMPFEPSLFQNFDLSSLKLLSFKVTHLNYVVNPFGISPGCIKGISWVNATEQYEGLITLFQALVNGSSNLETLEFSIPSKDFKEGYDANAKFTHFLTSNIPKSVQHLKLVVDIGDANLRELQSRNLQLQTFHINLKDCSMSTEGLLGFFETHKDTLIDLNISDLKDTATETLAFPVCSKLKVLEMKGASTLSFIKAFPKLEKLILNKPSSFIVQPTEEPGLPQSQEFLKDLKLTYEARSSFINQMAYLFPKIQKLEIKVGEETLDVLPIVFELMQNLKELHIEFTLFRKPVEVDPIFTGIPIDNCRSILAQGSLSTVDISGIARNPNFTNLQFVKKLELKCESAAVKLTDVTAQFALMESPSLQQLQTFRFNISQDYCQKLYRRFDLQPPTTEGEFKLPAAFSLDFYDFVESYYGNYIMKHLMGIIN